MDNFSVKPDRLENSAAEIKNIVKKLQSVGNTVSSVRSGLRWQVKQRAQIDHALSTLRTNSVQLASKSNKLSNGLSKCASTYSKTESSIISRANVRTGTAEAQASGSGGNSGSGTGNSDDQELSMVVRAAVERLFETLGPGGRLKLSPLSLIMIPQTILTTVGPLSMLLSMLNIDASKSGNFDWSVLNGEASKKGKFLGYDAEGKAEGGISKLSLDGEAAARFNQNDGEAYIRGKGSYSGAEGSLYGSLGLLSGKASGTLIDVEADGRAGFQLYKDGKFNPGIYASAAGKASVASGKIEGTFGTETTNYTYSASGDLLTAEAAAKAGIGYLGLDKDGKAEYGVIGQAKAGAYIAKGKVSHEINLFGTEIKVELSGKAGVGVGGEIGATNHSIDIGGDFALGPGVGLKLSVDWSNASVNNIISDTTQFISNAATTVDNIANTANYVFDKAQNALNSAEAFLNNLRLF